MRVSSGEEEFCKWLLKLGNGEIHKLKISENCKFYSLDELIQSVFEFECKITTSEQFYALQMIVH